MSKKHNKNEVYQRVNIYFVTIFEQGSCVSVLPMRYHVLLVFLTTTGVINSKNG